jgi:hypothetical protein
VWPLWPLQWVRTVQLRWHVGGSGPRFYRSTPSTYSIWISAHIPDLYKVEYSRHENPEEQHPSTHLKPHLRTPPILWQVATVPLCWYVIILYSRRCPVSVIAAIRWRNWQWPQSFVGPSTVSACCTVSLLTATNGYVLTTDAVYSSYSSMALIIRSQFHLATHVYIIILYLCIIPTCSENRKYCKSINRYTLD